MSPTSRFVKHRKQSVKLSPLQTIGELETPSLWAPQDEHDEHRGSKLNLFSLTGGEYGNDEKSRHSQPILRWVRTLQNNIQYHIVSQSSCSGRNSGPRSSRVTWFIASLFVTITFIKVGLLLPPVSRQRRLYYTLDTADSSSKVKNAIDLNILLRPSSGAHQNFHKIDHLRDIRESEYDDHDYGGIQYPERPASAYTDEDYIHNNPVVLDIQKDIDAYETYRDDLVATWDDAEHISKEYWQKEDLEDTLPRCRIPSWNAAAIPTCNVAHELSFERIRPNDQEYNITYMGSGTYRDAFRFMREDDSLSEKRDDFVVKRLLHRRDFSVRDIFKIRREASIFDQLSRSPVVLDMYGYCGSSVLLESMDINLWKHVIYQKKKGQYSQRKLDAMDHPSMNNFTITEKLQMAIDMAESLAAMHGNKDGEIIHSDVHIEQWLLNSEGKTKLNDFNCAVIAAWDDNLRDYCYHERSYGGIFHSPEEYGAGGISDARVDVYSLGNNIYTLLTGLWPFYRTKERSHSSIRFLVAHGRRPYVDPRFRNANETSYIESGLVKIMERCWKQDRTKRIDIFSVVKYLRHLKIHAASIGEYLMLNDGGLEQGQ